MSIKNKTIIVTGASQGLGKTVSEKLAAQGATVILVARSESLLKDSVTELRGKGYSADYAVCDIREPDHIKKTVKEIITKYKNIDILINNAGVWTDNNLEKTRPELRQAAFKTNALGNIEFTYALLPLFQKNNSGHIFNVISTAGIGNIPAGDNTMWQTYGATKWAMTGFTQTLRQKLINTKIKVTGFYPGGFDSNLYENVGKDNPYAQPWMMRVDDIANILVFMLDQPNDVLIEQLVVTKVM